MATAVRCPVAAGTKCRLGQGGRGKEEGRRAVVDPGLRAVLCVCLSHPWDSAWLQMSRRGKRVQSWTGVPAAVQFICRESLPVLRTGDKRWNRRCCQGVRTRAGGNARARVFNVPQPSPSHGCTLTSASRFHQRRRNDRLIATLAAVGLAVAAHGSSTRPAAAHLLAPQPVLTRELDTLG